MIKSSNTQPKLTRRAAERAHVKTPGWVSGRALLSLLSLGLFMLEIQIKGLWNKSQMHVLLLLSSKEVPWSWAWMNDVLAYPSPNPHPTTPPIVARWLSHRQFLGQTMLISHHSFVNEVVSDATDNQISWSWHLFIARRTSMLCRSPNFVAVASSVVFIIHRSNALQQGTKRTHHHSHLQK